MTENSHIKLVLLGTGFATMEKCEKAADALVEKGYRKQEWISIADRLPDDSMTVITFNMNGEVDADYYAAYSLGFTDKTVTHWMPLPEPPKMKGGAE